MATFAPLPTYLVSAICLTLGLNGLFRPEAEYSRFGLSIKPAPVPSTTSKTTPNSQAPTIFPFVYVKSIREITYGLALIGLQYQNQEAAITTLAAVMSLAGLGDGLVVWLFGGENKWTAMNHWTAFVGLLGWAVLRCTL
ncbi:hypothetical protein BJX99DRAFT_133402 [Aspergillus californicus]